MGTAFVGNAKNALEGLTGAMGVIDTDHGYIHDGIGFIAFLQIGDLAQGASEEFSFVCENGKYPHFKNLFLKATGASVKVEILHGTNANPLVINSAGSTASELIGPKNLNDISTKESCVTIKKTPTYVTSQDGEVWFQASISGNTTNQTVDSGSFSQAGQQELVMKTDTYYVIKVTNVHPSDDASEVGISAFWYEESDGYDGD